MAGTSPFVVAVRTFVLRSSRFGRFADLALGAGMLIYGILFSSMLAVGCGIFGLVAFAIDLNGRVQRGIIGWAERKAARKSAARGRA